MTYVVQPGDSLWAIAQRFNVSVQALISANPGMDPNRLYVGQRLTIPAGQVHTGQPPTGAGAAAGGIGLNQRVAQLEEIVDYHRRQIADLQRRVGRLEQQH